jgi:hypothetical protein
MAETIKVEEKFADNSFDAKKGKKTALMQRKLKNSFDAKKGEEQL